MTTGGHQHGGPELPALDTYMYGREGRTDPALIAAAVGADFAECTSCRDRRLDDIAADPMMTSHLVALAYQAMVSYKVDIPAATTLAQKYFHTTAAMLLALSTSDFPAALLFAENASVHSRRRAAGEALKVWTDLMRSGQPIG